MALEIEPGEHGAARGSTRAAPRSPHAGGEIAFLVLDADLRVQETNAAFRDAFLARGEPCEGRLLADLPRAAWNGPELREGLLALLRGGGSARRFEMEGGCGARDGRCLLVDALVIRGGDDRSDRILIVVGDGRRTERPGAPPLTERLEHVVAERTLCVRLLQDIAVIANEAETLEEALRRAMERVCLQLGWPIGHVYLASPEDPQCYVDSGIWWMSPGRSFGRFPEATGRLRLRPGQGLIGHVAMTGQPAWMPDLTTDPLYLRKAEAAEAGLRSALAFPILVGRRVAGVVEFYAYRGDSPDATLLEGLEQLGTQLGRVAEREGLERRLADVSENERRRFGRDLHDTLGQQITGIGLLLGALRGKIDADPGGARKLLVSLEEIVGEAKAQLAALESGVLPVKVDARGLMHALEELAEQTTSQLGRECVFECHREVPVADNFTATQLYYIASEAVHNAVKHGRASRVIVRLDGKEGRLDLEVEDDGVGMEHVAENPGGRGLRIMRYRARIIGAAFSIESRRGEGVRVRCTLAREA